MVYATRPSQSGLKIVIPALRKAKNRGPPRVCPSKRKSAKLDHGHSDTKGEPKFKHKKQKHTHLAAESDDEGEAESTLLAPAKRRPGRPRKDPAAKELAAAAKQTSFAVPCYISVPQAPLFVAGRSHFFHYFISLYPLLQKL